MGCEWRTVARDLIAAGLTFADLWDRSTPHQIVATLFRPATRPAHADAVGDLAQFNRRRAKGGLPPVCPGWLWRQE